LAEIKRLQKIYGHPKIMPLMELSPLFPAEKVFERVKELCPEMVFEVGMQSINPKVLERVNRPHDRKKTEAVVDLAKKHGITVMLDVMIGLPDDSFFSQAATIFFCVEREYYFGHILTKVLEQTDLKAKASDFELKYAGFAPDIVLASSKASLQQINKIINLAKVVRKEFMLGHKDNESLDVCGN
jgi:histone acetyltransferase (RNA polymerase elongator complex component)